MRRDCVIIRYRKIGNPWSYEICSEDDLDNYNNTAADYQRCGQEIINWANQHEFEVVYDGQVDFSEDILKSLGVDFESIGDGQ